MNASERFEKIHRELQKQATPRVIIGLIILVLILVFTGLTNLSNAVSQLHSEVDDLNRERRLELSLLNDQGWVDRAASLQTNLTRTHTQFWTGRTSGIIAAQLQGSIETAARNARLDRIRVTVEAVPEQLGSQALVFEISVNAQDRNGQFLAFFQELSRLDNQLKIQRFDWREQNGLLEVRIEAPARLLTREQEG